MAEYIEDSLVNADALVMIHADAINTSKNPRFQNYLQNITNATTYMEQAEKPIFFFPWVNFLKNREENIYL